ncbi:M1 family metallopeptidase [Carboxylicivirga sp. RSCT41]|uniref:M1 family metallopeptidase n=1 Tax=Carboxylicivirga agarovorans TaxID=3417570 RepID=UPI003D33272C
MIKTYFFLLPLLFMVGCSTFEKPAPDNGVSQQLAKQRAGQIDKLNYHLSIVVPDDKDEPIDGMSKIQFELSKAENVFLDFKASNEQLQQLIINKDTVDSPSIINEHIKLSKKHLVEGVNTIKIKFILGDGALNRNDDYFYALFVPDRARTAIPCFDQPDIKGRFAVKMELPESWTGIANGEPTVTQKLNNRIILEFAPSQPISTYLWAFTAGTYQFDSVNWKGKKIGMFHMVDDTIKYQRNIDEVFRQTLASLDWLEDFTAYDYPFETYNLVAIPSFQFGGMEHPGATYYRAEKIFLDENPTRNEELGRANLIAHETAHMWFGDLVTMPWFDEVWLKEVFANFMADKITEPWFQDMNHQLRFLMAHFPPAYAVDRTAGANPIGQKLKNLKNAGTLYGGIIYHKSPIVMKQLENIAGTENLQKGIREYVAKNAYGNASWNDLIACIDKYTETDLKVWSNAWVFEPGRPVLYFEPSEHDMQAWKLKQIPEHANLASTNTYWPQEVNILQDATHLQYQMYDAQIDIPDNPEKPNSLFFADDAGYGLARITQLQQNYWLKEMAATEDDLLRGRLAINLYENFLDGSISPDAFINYLKHAILSESNPIILNQLSNQLQSTYWKFIPDDIRKTQAPLLEEEIYRRILEEDQIANKKTLFRLWSSICVSREANDKIKDLLQGNQSITGLTFSDNDLIRIVTQLSIKGHPEAKELQTLVLQNLKSKHNKEKLEFLLPSLSNNQAERDEFFLSLSQVENRSKEGWVQNALANLHHPLRTEHSIHYLHTTLELLEEIQLTGDIFFPIGWLGNSFSGHSSENAYNVANQFLINNPNYPEHLKLKILQNIDMTYRAYTIKDRYY